MAEKNISLQLVFDENLKKNTNIPTTERLAFDDLGDFIEERNKIQRFLERRVDADLKVDYSDFSNHVFFDSAVQKVDIATQRILNKYPFNGTSEEKDAFHLTGSAYERYFFEQWPREVAYTFFNGTNQYISASDVDSKLWIGTSSLYVSAWIKPVVTDQNMIVQYMSASTGPVLKHGYEFYLSGSTDPHLKFSIHSGSEVATVSASYEAFTASFNNVAAIYDKGTSLVNLFINNDLVSSASVSFGLIGTKAATKFYVGSGSQHTANSSSFDFYSGSLNEVRVLHTGSSLFHKKNYSRPIDAEEYVRLNYKFNEGITETGSIDSFVVDYSRNGIHGKFVNYSSGSRVSGSVMVSEPGDPILYNFHSRVVNFTGSLQLSASLYDLQNKNQIFNLIPEGVLLEDDLADGLLRNFSLAMARFFDEQKLYIDQFINLRTTNYEGVDETPDAFLPHLKRYFGWKVSEHFNNANPLEYLFGENIVSSGSLEVPLVDIRNQFWRRILNNLPLLLKSKGTRKNLDYLFNSLGLNKENIILKEYGYLPGTSIQDERVSKQKVQARLGFGTGSFTGSFLKSQDVIISDGPSTDFTVEAMLQLPFPSASYTGSLVTGSIWSFQDEVSCVNLYYVRTNQESQDGKFVLSSSEGSVLSSSNLSVFDGDFIHVAAGKDAASGNAFIKVREIEGNDIILSQDFTGSSTFLISSSDYYLVVGANSGSVYDRGTQGFFGEVRYWERELSGSEIDDHALNFQSVGLDNPYAETSPLKGHWALNEDNRTDASGILSGVVDLSRNGNPLIGEGFAANINPYDKFVHDYNYLSPAVDLKWTENKIRIRNKTELRPKDAANDTNEVSLEFSLIEALNEDIVKIFSTLDILNNLIGEPVFKYRDEYSDLEGVRRKYFERLSDNLNFSQFFNLFTWFDKKISDAIKQLLPTRVKFIGGEQVIESHLLERPRYRYQYPIFRTPQDPPEAVIDVSLASFGGEKMEASEGEIFFREEERKFPHVAFVGEKFLLDFSSSLSNLSQSLTINNTTVSPTFLYKGQGASSSGWTATVGETLSPVNASGVAFNQGTPLTNDSDQAVGFDGTGQFIAGNNTFANIGTNDFVIEIVAYIINTGTNRGFLGKYLNPNGWYVWHLSSNQFRIYLWDTNSVNVSTAALDDGWHHLMCFVNRDEDSSSGAQWYVNGVANGSGADLSALNANIDADTAFRLGNYPGQLASRDTIAYAAMWQASDWHQAGSAGPDEWAEIAKERFQKLAGFYPRLAYGTALANSYSRSSIAHLDKNTLGIRSLFQVGPNWPRVVRRRDSTETPITGYLSEASVTNLCLQSEDFATTWSPIESDEGDIIDDDNSVETPSGVTSWNGYIIPSIAEAEHGVSQDIFIEVRATYAFSVWAKMGPSENYPVVRLAISTLADVYADFNLRDELVESTGANATSYMENWGNGWFRCAIVLTTESPATHTFQIQPALEADTPVFAGDGSEIACCIWGAQLETGVYPTSYIPTTTATATRSADTLQYKMDEGNLKQGAGVVSWDMLADPNNAVRYPWALSDGGSTGERINALITAGNSIWAQSAKLGGQAGQVSTSVNVTDGEIHKLAVRYGPNLLELQDGGSTIGTPDTTVDIPEAIDELDIGGYVNDTGQLNGVISNLEIYYDSIFTENILVEPRNKKLITADVSKMMKSQFLAGETSYKNKDVFFPIKVSGDQFDDVNNSNTGVNFRNEFARKILIQQERDNE